jgi:hypothetical protein
MEKVNMVTDYVNVNTDGSPRKFCRYMLEQHELLKICTKREGETDIKKNLDKYAFLLILSVFVSLFSVLSLSISFSSPQVAAVG